MTEYEELVARLNEWLEYDTFNRFQRLIKAQENALADLGIDSLGWGSGYALLEKRRRKAKELHERRSK